MVEDDVFVCFPTARVLVLDEGTIKELDSPEALLRDRESIFYGLAKQTGLV